MSQQKLGFFARLFRKKIKLTYWVNGQPYSIEVCDFTEQSPECIVYKDYYTAKSTLIKSNDKIPYVLEQIK